LDSDQLAEEVAAYGSGKLGKRFGIFSGWLSGKTAEQDRHHAGMHAIAAKYGQKGFAAFQMISSQTPSRFNPAGSSRFAEGGLKVAVEQGMGWNARYFEIWQTDAMNPQLHPLLEELAARLKK
jgi:hypothetical protein